MHNVFFYLENFKNNFFYVKIMLYLVNQSGQPVWKTKNHLIFDLLNTLSHFEPM